MLQLFPWMRLPWCNIFVLEKPITGYFKLINLRAFSACISLGDDRLAKETMLPTWGPAVAQGCQQPRELSASEAGADKTW